MYLYMYMYRHNLHDNRKKYVSNSSSVINEAENARTVVQKLLEQKKNHLEISINVNTFCRCRSRCCSSHVVATIKEQYN